MQYATVAKAVSQKYFFQKRFSTSCVRRITFAEISTLSALIILNNYDVVFQRMFEAVDASIKQMKEVS